MSKKIKMFQRGGLLNRIGRGVSTVGNYVGDNVKGAFGQGIIGNDRNNYDYANTADRATSYDGLQYVPQAPVSPFLAAYQSRYSAKNFYDPAKHTMDTSAFEKDLKTYHIDKEGWMNRKEAATAEIAAYIALHNTDEQMMAQLPMFIVQQKDKLTRDTQGLVNTYDENQTAYKKYVSEGKHGIQYRDNGESYFTRTEKQLVNGVEKNVRIVRPQSEILNRLGSLSGWKAATPRDLQESYEYINPENPLHSKKMMVNLNDRDTALTRMQAYFKDAETNSKAEAIAGSYRQANIGGYNSDMVIFHNTSSKVINENNFKQIEEATKEINQLDPVIRDGLMSAFYSEMKAIINVPVYDKDGNAITTEENGVKGVKLQATKIEDMNNAQLAFAQSAYIANAIIRRAAVNTTEKTDQNKSSSVNMAAIVHGAGSGAALLEKQKRDRVTDLSDMVENGQKVRTADTIAARLFGQDFTKRFGENSVWQVKKPLLKSASTGATITEDIIGSAAITWDGTILNKNGIKLVLTKDGKRVEGNDITKNVHRLGQNIMTTTVYTDESGEEINYSDKMYAVIQAAISGNEKAREALKEHGIKTQQITGMEVYALKMGEIGTTIKGGVIIPNSSTEGREILKQQLALHSYLGPTHASVVALKGALTGDSGSTVVLTRDFLTGKTPPLSTYFGSGTLFTDNNNATLYPTEEQGVIPKRQEGGTIQQQITLQQQNTLPDITLDDLY